jgi:hypothetical protein
VSPKTGQLINGFVFAYTLAKPRKETQYNDIETNIYSRFQTLFGSGGSV